MSRAADLPDYKNPPIDEVAFGLLFPALPGFSDGFVSLFWEVVRNEYPTMEPVPRVEVQLETLEPGPPTAQALTLPTFQGPGQMRTWFTSGDDQFVVQVQNTRFFLNWRRRDQAYPHFDEIAPRFWSVYDLFVSTLKEHAGGRPALQQLEVSYINWIDDLDISVFFKPTFAARATIANISNAPTTASTAMRYLVNDSAGRPIAGLHVQCVPSMRLVGGIAQQGAQLHLNFRAPFKYEPNREKIVSVGEAGRDAIVRLFTDLTTDEAHKVWGRTK